MNRRLQPSRLHYPPSFLFRFGVLFRLLFHFLLKDRAVLLSPHLRPHCILRHTHAHTHTQRVKDTGALWSGIGVKCAGMHGTHLKIGLPASHFMCSFSLNANNSGIMASRQAQSTKQQNQRHCVCVCVSITHVYKQASMITFQTKELDTTPRVRLWLWWSRSLVFGSMPPCFEAAPRPALACVSLSSRSTTCSDLPNAVAFSLGPCACGWRR